MDSSSSSTFSSPPSSSSHNWKHHVFPSFHGADVRRSFLDHILKQFTSKGIDTFIGNGIEWSKSIRPELIEGIRGSRIAIVMLSRNYASSTWCLDELVEIMKCREELGQLVIPLFYELDPSDVKKQTGHFGKVFRKTCEGKTKEDIERWRHALSKVATMVGYHSRDWEKESDLIEKVATDIAYKLNYIYSTPKWDFEGLDSNEDEVDMSSDSASSSDSDNPVGMEAHMKKMKEMLSLESDEVRMIGIAGPRGIGKTTIANYTYQQFSHQFHFSTIMANINECFASNCHNEEDAELQLQMQLLSQLSNQTDDTDEIFLLGVAQERLKDKKVLVVVDDVDGLRQLDALAKEIRCFGPGSRIIFITKDQRLLKACGIDHIYDVDYPPPDEALQIFNMYAFGQKSPYDGFTDLAQESATLSGKLPLGLRLMGTYLRDMSKQEWKNELPRLRTSLDGEIESVLKFSYKSLFSEDKESYHQHIGCSSNDDSNQMVEEFFAKTFSEVRQELIISNHDPTEDLFTSGRAFQEISNAILRLEYSPMTCWPSKLNPEFSVKLDMPNSKLENLWEGTQPLRNLRLMDISSSKSLTELPDLSTATNLKRLNLRSCSSLNVIDINCSDTLQYSFASHLSMNFGHKGIYAFVNCNGTLDEIEGASASVVVFSENYLSSTSCLDTLVRVLQCRRKNSQLVVPVFYGVSPSDFVVSEHESADRIREWSSALQELRELQGHQSREECSDSELVEEIVKDVYEKLFPTENIGINSRLRDIAHLLCKQTWGIRRIGIWGMAGIGKTTLAKAFFDQIAGGYEASCFIEQFDKAFHEKGLHPLLDEHFGKVLKELPGVCSSITRPRFPREKLNKKKTLVVLDDVHNPLVAESFLGGFHWFGPGSLIIITSRDKKVFRLCQINHVYEVQSLNESEALQLLSHCASGEDIREPKEMIDYANGNPLVLSFYGRTLKGKKLSETKTTSFKRELDNLHDIFKSSYETLDNNEKSIFLDIACFFKGENVDYVMQLLEGCGFFPHVGIDVLVEKCLVTISENKVNMHDLIQDVGREIINRETAYTGRQRRLWEPSSIKVLLEDEEFKANGDPKATYTHALGTEHIEGIFMDTSNLVFDVKPNAFENMMNLRYLKIYCPSDEKHFRLHLPKGLESLPCELRLLHWENYPLQSLPQDFDPCLLVDLNMPHSQLQKLWAGTKNLKMLKMVRLCHSQQLTEIDDICAAPNIKLIDLQGCTKLQNFPATGQLQHLRVVNLSGCREIKSLPEVSPNIEELYLQGTGIRELLISIGNVTNLKKLYLTRCASLVELPASIGNATSLEILDLGDCSSLMELPSSIGNTTNLQELNLEYCSSLVELPSSIGNATNLMKLCLTGCSSLVELPYSIGNATNLKELYLSGCSSLVELPASIANASNPEILDLSNCSSLVELPSSIGNATNLKKLFLTGCSSLVELPYSIGNATNLTELSLSGCSSLVELPASIANASNLKILDLSYCSSLVELPSSIGDATSLQELNLTYCLSLAELPSSIGNATNLKELKLGGCSSLVQLPSCVENATNFLVELPSSIGNLTNFYLTDCSSLVDLPSYAKDDIKVEDWSSSEEAVEPVSLDEEERLSQELEEIEAKYREEMKDIARKRKEAIMETNKKRALVKKGKQVE